MRSAGTIAAILAVVGFGVAADGDSVGQAVAAPTTADACTDLVRAATVQRVLGVNAAGVAGPQALGSGGCSWHSGDPLCSLRSLGVELIAGEHARSGFAQARAAALAADATADVVADASGQSFSTTSVTQVGMGAQIEKLDVLASGVWYRFSILGRLGDTGQELLAELAADVLSRHNRSA